MSVWVGGQDEKISTTNPESALSLEGREGDRLSEKKAKY